jgi:membrane carboxypeptidase/penicillin-binding protein
VRNAFIAAEDKRFYQLENKTGRILAMTGGFFYR